MPNTPRGYPYPAPTDPVAQGAATMQALAEAVELRQISVCARAWNQTMTNAWAAKPFTEIPWQDWNGTAIALSAIYTNAASGIGRYRVIGELNVGGQSGTGGCAIRLTYLRGSDAAELRHAYGGNYNLNEGCTAQMIVQTAMLNDHFGVYVRSAATGAAGTGDIHLTVQKLQ